MMMTLYLDIQLPRDNGFCFFIVIFSFHFSNAKMFELSKKRKFQAEQFGSPISKHMCWNHRLPLKSNEENQQFEDLTSHIIQENADEQAIDDGSDPESAKDSNSFVGDSDSSMSVNYESKFETEVSKQCPCDGPSSSSLNWVCNNIVGDPATAGAGKGEQTFVAEHDPYNHYNEIHQNLDEAIGEFESNFDHNCSDDIKPFIRKELDDILYPNGGNSNKYVLSSGRWSVNQDAQTTSTRKPTIDQEFEQYFSMLML